MTIVHLAIDSGGTRSTVVLSTADGPEEIHRAASRTTLSGYLAPDRVPTTLRDIVRDAEVQYRDSAFAGSPVSVFVGAAGFTAATRSSYRTALDDLVRDGFDGNVAIAGVANDAVTLLLGHDADGVVIAGTGSSILLRSSGSGIVQVGGHDWAAGDQGSGFWIGLDGVRRVAQEVDAGHDSELVDRFRQHFQASTRSDMFAQFRALSVADNGMKARIAGFAQAVCEAAERGDATAAAIVTGQAEALADLAARAIDRLVTSREATSPLTVVQCGGVFANQYYRALFEARATRHLRDGDVGAPPVDWVPVASGTDAAMALARDLDARAESLLAIPDRFRPVVVCRPTA